METESKVKEGQAGFNFDDYQPAEMEKRVESACVSKSKLSFLSLLLLAILAGAYISLGAGFFTLVVFDSSLSVGLTRTLGGIAFSLGLILVVIAGGELFTGNNMLMMGAASGVITYKQMLKNWGISYLGNFIGSLLMVFLMFLTGLWKMKDYMLGAKMVLIAADKVNLTFLEAFTRGIMCNLLVCLAVWLCYSARNVVSKIAAIIFPITAFVALGFEHSVANMYFIPIGILLKRNSDVVNMASSMSEGVSLGRLNITGFLGNLLPVTIGNIIGGAIMVALTYWLIIVLPHRRSIKERS
ncbi:MAG: formate/nitrite transporter family protein [Actinomycetota bacterium]|nr:formate/nitrite transporter family protein [Actinomycetota bacterium]